MEIDIDKVISNYAIELQSTYKSYSTIVKDLLSYILKTNHIVPHSVTNREKSPSSLKEKILRDSKNYEDPLSEITDLAGVRIITYFPEDVDKIVPLIANEFKIDEENSIDKRKKSDPSIFGYVSVHLVVELSDNRSSLPEYSSFAGLKCEIQVRTILQHAWAEIEHDIVYKSNEEIPFELRHRFASLAGLLEVADREFEQLRKEEIRVRKEIEKTILDDNYNLPINRDSLVLYLKKTRNELKFEVPDKEQQHIEISVNKRIGYFIKMLSDQKISTIQQLHKLLTEEVMSEASKEFERIEK
jgi:ppGpp synthetase/RelA/SpoT-type nucleotidyltranferase